VGDKIITCVEDCRSSSIWRADIEKTAVFPVGYRAVNEKVRIVTKNYTEYFSANIG
jgi:hypothetical protein